VLGRRAVARRQRRGGDGGEGELAGEQAVQPRPPAVGRVGGRPHRVQTGAAERSVRVGGNGRVENQRGHQRAVAFVGRVRGRGRTGVRRGGRGVRLPLGHSGTLSDTLTDTLADTGAVIGGRSRG